MGKSEEKRENLTRFSDHEYLRQLSIPELKFLSIFMRDDRLIKNIIKEKIKNDF